MGIWGYNIELKSEKNLHFLMFLGENVYLCNCFGKERLG